MNVAKFDGTKRMFFAIFFSLILYDFFILADPDKVVGLFFGITIGILVGIYYIDKFFFPNIEKYIKQRTIDKATSDYMKTLKR